MKKLIFIFLSLLALVRPGYGQEGIGMGGRNRSGFFINQTVTYAGLFAGQFAPVGSTYSNTAFGYAANRYMQFGTDNCAFGNEALTASSNTSSGYYNNAFGSFALRNVGIPGSTAGNYNNAFGYKSMYSSNYISGFSNSGFGEFTLSNLETGSGNVAIGSHSLETVRAGSNNTALGYQAGKYIYSGSNNITIGYLASGTLSGSSLSTGSNNIIIGGNAIEFGADASNQLNIQNIIYGTGNSGTGTTVSTGNIGIATAAPNVTFDVNGGIAYRQTTKAQITANQNDYAIGAQSSFRINSDAARNITGITGGFDGKLLIIRNTGAFAITFTHQDALSTATNRILCSTGANISLAANGTLTLQYDATTQRWFDIALR